MHDRTLTTAVRKLRGVWVLVGAALGAILAASPAASVAQTVFHGPAAITSTPDHIVIVLEENKTFSADPRYNEVIGSSDAPFLTRLAGQGLVFTRFCGEYHPSQANYISLFSGSDQDMTTVAASDSDATTDPRTGEPWAFDADNLAAELQRHGLSFGGYAENMPRDGFLGSSSGYYVRRHVPWANFPNINSTCSYVFEKRFPSDYGKLPTVSFVIPNMIHDMHGAGGHGKTSEMVSAGDSWVRDNLGDYVEWAKTHNSMLIVTFDESDTHREDRAPGGLHNHIPALFVGPMVPSGVDDMEQAGSSGVNHYNLLRTIEELYGLPPMADGDRGAAALVDLPRRREARIGPQETASRS